MSTLPGNRKSHPLPDKRASKRSMVAHRFGRANRNSQSRSQCRHYQTETSRPIVSFYFTLPFLLAYEAGVIFWNDRSIRNGLDVWLDGMLATIGVPELFLLPAMLIATLLYLHQRNADHCSVNPAVLAGMAIESVGLALIVFWATKAQHLWIQQISVLSTMPAMELVGSGQNQIHSIGNLQTEFLSFCGAGLYEELVFRLLLLPGLIALFLKIRCPRSPATVLAIGVVSMLFAAAHCQFLNPAAPEFELASFLIRCLASIYFCGVYLFRGFGIAVGTHIAYDLLIQI